MSAYPKSVQSVQWNSDATNEFSVRRSIPTEYNGTRFRSKLEADYARAFDALGIVWEYEKVGQYFGDQFYLVDFWLPKSRQYVEVKGVFEPDDCRKIQSLLSHVSPRPCASDTCPDIPIVACVPDGKFYGWERRYSRGESFFDFLKKRSIAVDLFACAVCRGWWFGDPDWSWRCQCCGAYAGNGHIAAHLGSPIPQFPNPNALHFFANRD